MNKHFELGELITRQTLDHVEELEAKILKSESKLKMMEISFEQVNNSRNDLIKQLSEQEKLNETLQSKVDKVREFAESLDNESGEGYAKEKLFAIVKDPTV